MTLVVTLVLLMSSASLLSSAQQQQYCRFTPQHTLCQHQGLGPRCGNRIPNRGISAEDIAFITNRHNQLRAKVALGQEARGAPGPQPPASDMRVLQWDNELAAVAQSHADQCIFEHECGDCRRVGRFSVGQNLFISFQSNFDTKVEWGRAIQAWYVEVAEFNPGHIKPFRFASGVGHYTQMLWSDTYTVGCGYTMFEEGGWWKKLYTCNYGPGGNIISTQMYRVGNPCSSCPAGTTCSLTFPGLCGPVAGGTQVINNNQVGFQRPQVPTTFRPQFPVQNNQILPFLEEEQEQEFEQEFEQEQEELQNSFIPMGQSTPTITDLLPFLRRNGITAPSQVIRTNSLASVQNIIGALPPGTRPLVLFRSGSGQLTELNSQSLQRRFGRSTTPKGRRLNQLKKTGAVPDILLTCDLDVQPCEITPFGGNWTIETNEEVGMHMATPLETGAGSQIVIRRLVEAPSTGVVCVAIAHQRTLNTSEPGDTAATNSTIEGFSLPDLQVGVWPLGREVLQENVAGREGKWEISTVTLAPVRTPFLIVLTVGPNRGPDVVNVAFDALQVTNGLC